MRKKCSKCERIKSSKQFNKDSRYSKGLFCWCKKCERDYSGASDVRKRNRARWARDMKNPRKRAAERRRSKAKYWKNPRKQKDAIYRRKYKISLKQFEKAKRCALCFERCELVPDHNHKTNKYRGPLCRRCNLAMAQVDNYPCWLKRVKKYLRRG